MDIGKRIIKYTTSRLVADAKGINHYRGEEITVSLDIAAYSFLYRKAASYGHEDALRYLSSLPPAKP